MAETDESIHAQLIEARDKLRRELEILSAPSSIGGGSNDGSVISAMEDELRQIEDVLANRV